MKIVYVAFSCAPCYGSEARIGWRIPIEAAKANEVIVFTAAGNKHVIESYLKDNPVPHISFQYVGIPTLARKLFKGPLFSGQLLFWNKGVSREIKRLATNEQIDVIHQLSPVEFRAIGNYGKIAKDISYVCGPVGGRIHSKVLKNLCIWKGKTA